VDDFSPNVTLRFKPRDDQMLYLTFAKGFKSGGFTLWPIVPQASLAADIEFDDEKTVHYEIGGKHDLWEGRGRFNWAAWHTQFDDIQVSTLDPILLVQSVSNAAQATSQGLEGDLLWSLHDYVGFTASFAYTDAKFDKYAGAPCYFSQTPATGCVGGVQDLAGTQLPYAAEWQFSSGLNGTIPVGERFTFGYDLLYYWRDDQYLQLDHDRIDVQEAYGKLNATISFGPDGGRWRVALVGKNLTDELTANFSNDSAAVGATGGNPHFKFSEAPRTFAIQVRAQF
jgi:iron complex outermembrane receptor protein